MMELARIHISFKVRSLSGPISSLSPALQPKQIWRSRMWKAALVGAVALATMGSNLALADESADRGQVSAQSGFVLTEAHISQARQVLRLTAEQEKYWPAVEAALRHLVQHRSQDDGSGGMLSRIGNRAAGAASAAMGIKRVWAAAQPLIRVLDEDQKRSAMAMVHSLGIGKLASAL
jgi:hypothetical protein